MWKNFMTPLKKSPCVHTLQSVSEMKTQNKETWPPVQKLPIKKRARRRSKLKRKKHHQNMVFFADFHRRKNRHFSNFLPLSPLLWFSSLSSSVSCRFLTSWPIAWSVTMWNFWRNLFLFWAGTFLDEDRYVEAAISYGFIIAPLVAKWVSFGEYIDKKCKQRISSNSIQIGFLRKMSTKKRKAWLIIYEIGR